MDKELVRYEESTKYNLKEALTAQSSYIFYPHLDYLRILAKKVVNTLEEYVFQFNPEEDYREFPVYTLGERLKLIDDFYKYIDSNVDVYDLFNKGLLNFKGYQYEEELLNQRVNIPYTDGRHYYKRKKKISYANVKNTGYFIDCATAVHELSHYQDERRDGYLYEVNEFMTEALADTYEYMLMDYYKKEHSKEILWIRRERLRYYYIVSRECLDLLSVFCLYNRYGDISENLYKEYFNENDYVDVLKRLKKARVPMDITITEYLVCSSLAPYLAGEYEKDNSFAQTIKSFHKIIKDEDFTLLLRKMHLDTYINPLTNELEIDYSKTGDRLISYLEGYARSLYKNERRM